MPDDHARGELIFQWVPEIKTVENRFYLCLEPDTSRAEEVERLTALTGSRSRAGRAQSRA